MGQKPSLGVWGLRDTTVLDRAVLWDKGDINFLVAVNYLTIGNLKKDGFILACSLRVQCPQWKARQGGRRGRPLHLPQKAESNEGRPLLSPLSHFIQPRIPALSPTFRMGLPI